MKLVMAFLSGFIFAAGIGISGMAQPQKIIGFLDLLGNWDPSLLFVMGGALAVHFISYRFANTKKIPKPVYDQEFHLPLEGAFTKSLILGSATFGIGWGLSGYCPGPAIVALGSGNLQALIMVCAMNLGIGLGTMGEDHG